jgi:NADH-quinone oxidoreductase subunit N
MSTLPKLAGFLAMLRLLGGIQLSAGLVPVALTTLVLVGLLTMTVGNCAALVQTNCRRMLAYSSVAQSGYLLLGVAGILVQGELVRSVLVYLSAYVVMTLGFFAGLCSTAGSPNQKLDLEELDGLSGKNVLVGGAMTVCLLSLIGIPVTAGFWGKFFILRDLLAPSTSLLIIGAIVMVANSAIAAVYYLGLLMRVNTNQVSSGGAASLSNAHDCASTDLPATIACVACAALTLIWFVFPKWM